VVLVWSLVKIDSTPLVSDGRGLSQGGKT